MRALAGTASLLLGALAGCSEPAPPPHVLLVTLDTTRADALGCYSGDRGSTPTLNGLAASGARLEEARTVAPLTLPSHATLLTGLYPFEHGIRDNGLFELPDSCRTLAEIFRDHGYRTGAVVAAAVLNESFGLGQGFDQYFDLRGSGGMEAERTADQVIERALSWWREGGEGPRFLWAHFFDPHRPLQPPLEILKTLASGPEEIAALPEIERERLLYRAEVQFLDQQLERLLEAVRAQGPALICVVADHGEGNGDHGELAHGYFLYDSTLRVPWILAGPGIPAGIVRDAPVSTVDLFPTLLELAGLPPASCSGVSLVPLLRGAPWSGSVRPLYFETCYPYTNHRWSPLYGMQGERYKLIDSPAAELFDLECDPGELESLLAQQPQAAAMLRQSIRALAERAVPSALRTPGEQELRDLKALGYAGGSAAPEDPAVFLPGRIDPALRDPKTCQELIQLHGKAFTEFSRGNAAGAAELMLKAVRLDPENPLFLDQAGSFLVLAGRLEEACDILEKAVALDPRLLLAWQNLAEACYRLGKASESEQALHQVLLLDPSHVKARLCLSQIAENARQYDDAIHWLESALDCMGEDAALRATAQAKLVELRRRRG